MADSMCALRARRIEIEVDEDQTILRAAAEQGVMLMHGCKKDSAPHVSHSSSM